MNKIVLWFVKITGFIPQIFYFRKKVYYVNKKTQSRRIKGKAIIVSNHKRLFDFVLLMYLFLGRDIYTIIGEQMNRKNKLFPWFLNKIGGILFSILFFISSEISPLSYLTVIKYSYISLAVLGESCFVKREHSQSKIIASQSILFGSLYVKWCLLFFLCHSLTF